ncbi:hypothetical protein jhhlp_004710 [Lomentospora prolificans]|uniref:Uncharacterized protein n=1 Tax=Lomentospora prolificans TaxID=41688 RepID=A0A2N3N8A4_9PEZI|nr:hypothetical protein jhhlp_004710 [Lomentospora prolificans]
MSKLGHNAHTQPGPSLETGGRGSRSREHKEGQLSHEPNKNRSSKRVNFADPINMNQEECYSSSSLGSTPSSSSLGSTPNQGIMPIIPPAGASVKCTKDLPTRSTRANRRYSLTPSSLAWSNAINNTINAEVAHEIEAVLDGLGAAVHSGKRQPDTLDKLYPLAKEIPPGSTTRNLTLPPIDKVFTCLRMVRECQQVAMLCLGDFMRPTQFSDDLSKSYGLATEADLIIVHCGLYWLFCECFKAVTDEETKQDYDAQAFICHANLETVLANLCFHQQPNIDVAYAMGWRQAACLLLREPIERSRPD